MAAMKQQPPDNDAREALRLYEEYAKPLEPQHKGEYVAVSIQGKTVLGTDLLTLVDQAAEELGPGNYIFKIGEIAVGKWLCLTPAL
jgi:hypothetical protein